MTKDAPVKISPELVMQIETGLYCLSTVCEYVNELIGSDGANEYAAVLALIQKSGALIETALLKADVLGSGVMGGAEGWLGIERAKGGAQ